MSLWARVFGRGSKGGEGPPGGRGKEDRGDLEGALAEYEREGLHDEALRVALTLADATADPAARVRLLARAIRTAGQSGEVPQALRARYARARLDVLRASGSPPVWELGSLGRELESLDEHLAAAEAYKLAGDKQAEARMLVAGGDIEQLEGILETENARVRSQRERARTLADMTALDSSGQRRAALEAARGFLASHPTDEEVKRLSSALEARLCKAPSVRLKTASGEVRWVVGREVVLGRNEGEIALGSPLVSRKHLRFSRGASGEPTVEDLGTRNGTLLGGARLAGPLPVRSPLALSLGGEIACVVSPHREAAVSVEVGGDTWLLALDDEGAVGPWRLRAEGGCIRLSVPAGAQPPVLGDGVAAGEGVDLCVGDVVLERRGGPEALRVLP